MPWHKALKWWDKSTFARWEICIAQFYGIWGADEVAPPELAESLCERTTDLCIWIIKGTVGNVERQAALFHGLSHYMAGQDLYEQWIGAWAAVKVVISAEQLSSDLEDSETGSVMSLSDATSDRGGCRNSVDEGAESSCVNTALSASYTATSAQLK
ncbi:hypothetical protein QFC20_007154 [Naganishia adeliensis]|uniref:Uncharacterized protein n=1 Tax=Naganishia adeliensis TaxID=92952 RepID=A0ACC2V3A9_9TREE|nr:hypothetical protein QFC20_007154 [Naganishia adeliensis]